MSKLQLLRRDATGVTYANPNDPDYQIRFKTVTGNKKMNGVMVPNYVTEIILNDVNPVKIRDVDANDLCSVRVRVSGSFSSDAHKRAMLKSLCNQLNIWADENILSGFEPTTLPEGL